MMTFGMVEKAKEALREELKRLERELRVELPREIQRARALGDLRENAEYQAALERQNLVRARVGQIKRKLMDLSTVNSNNLPRDRAALGTIVTLLDLDSGAEVRYELVVSEESDAANGRISVNSPIGKGLLGCREGDERSIRIPSGVKRYEVVEVRTVHDRDVE
jgi:transcription elongation factor GreA